MGRTLLIVGAARDVNLKHDCRDVCTFWLRVLFSRVVHAAFSAIPFERCLWSGDVTHVTAPPLSRRSPASPKSSRVASWG